ncbi:hypothetical protein DUNSADRAFT_5863 [Dunaliella salina]|uniref:Encoded protein n=1 Tax=Dunaliella salina TaxID=3046 RepID=A0ABQ7GPE7_DUNSA|nr:hypothetical protein DUNSADRAFT_5863 [Dunaliella salina]|eukprot:KAF5836477.1 hypothetical protein DUNSADRAFT_5863 [Dunaliella salina]
MMEASKLARLKQERLREAEAFLALSNDEGRGLSAEKLSALRAANRFRVRRHTCDPSQGDEEVWLHDKIMAACTGKGAEPENMEGVEQGPREDVVHEAGSTPMHATQAPTNEGHAGRARAAHPSQPTEPDTRRGPNTKGSSRQPAQYADYAAAMQLSDHAVAPPPDRFEAGSKPGQPSSGGTDTAVDGAGKAAAEEEQRQQELSRGAKQQEAVTDVARSFALITPLTPFPRILFQQLLQAEFMVANGMHLPGQRSRALYPPLSYPGDEGGALDGQSSFDERPSDPGPIDSPSFDSSPSSPNPPLPLLQIRNSAPSLFPERSEPSSTSPRRRPPKDPGLPPKHSNSVGQALFAEPQAAVELQQRQQKQVKLPPLLQKGEPVHKHKANSVRGAQAKQPLHITGWVQTGGGMNHRLLSGRKPDKAG